MAHDLLTTAEAAAAIQPHLRGLDAFQWLTDTRRRERHYNDPARPPVPVRKPGSKKPLYRRADIERVIADLRGLVPKSLPSIISPAPTVTTTPAPVAPVVILGGGDRVQVVIDGRVVKLDPTTARRLATDLAFAADRAEAA